MLVLGHFVMSSDHLVVL